MISALFLTRSSLQRSVMAASVDSGDAKALKTFRDHLLAAQAGTNQDLQEGVYKCGFPCAPTGKPFEPYAD